MMAENKIEQYLIELMLTYQEIGPNMWLLDDPEHNLSAIAVMYAEPLVVVRAEVMDVPVERRLELFTTLLELNAQDIVHGAYAVENGKVVLIDTLEYEGMDYVEFRATLDSFSLALTQHYSILAKYRG
jgi:hypothetical protein